MFAISSTSEKHPTLSNKVQRSLHINRPLRCPSLIARLGEKLAYRDRIYIIKDIIMKLVEYGELNVTSLVTYCGLNMQKHRYILDELESNGLISSYEVVLGKKKTVTIFKPTHKGIEFCKDILEVYEQMFPRNNFEKKSAEIDSFAKQVAQQSVPKEPARRA